MPVRLLIRFLVSAMTLVAFSGCGRQAPAARKPLVAVSVLPQEYFVRQIAGSRVDILVMIPPGSSPAVYDPSPQQIRRLSRAGIYFRIGHIPFEKAWISRLRVNPEMLMVDTSVGVKLRTGHAHHDGSTASGHSHGSHSVDPHIWLSPAAVKIQAAHIQRALAARFPAYKEEFRTNLHRFIQEIDRVRLEVDRLLKPVSGRHLAVYHPGWGYLLDLYGMHQLAVEMEGKAPSPLHMHRIIRKARQLGIRHVVVQQQFDSRPARVVAGELGGSVVRLDPLAVDWADNMVRIARRIAEISR